MRSDNLQLLCVQLPTSSYNPQLPHGCHGHGGHGHWLWTEQTGKTKLTIKLDFPGNLCMASVAILAMLIHLIFLRTASCVHVGRTPAHKPQRQQSQGPAEKTASPSVSVFVFVAA